MIGFLAALNTGLAILIICMGIVSLRLLPHGRRIEPVVTNVLVAVVYLTLVNGKHVSPDWWFSTSSVAWFWFDTAVLVNIALHQWTYTLRRRVTR